MEYKDGNAYNLLHERKPSVVLDEERPLDTERYKLHNQNIDLLELQTDDSVSVP